MCSDKQDYGSERAAGNHVTVTQISTPTDLVDVAFHPSGKVRHALVFLQCIHFQHAVTKFL